MKHLRLFSVLTAVVIGLSLVACGGGGGGGSLPTPTEEFHWGYEGEHGPSHWGDHYPDCNGTAQSPIDLVNATPDAGLPDLMPSYPTVGLDMINNGHTLEQTYPTAQTPGISFMGVNYDLLQFHFHTESEHTVAGQHADMELHAVHKAQSGALLVIAVLYEITSQPNPFLSQFEDKLPGTEDETVTDGSVQLDLGSALPTLKPYYAYNGSLTTPPCSEIVQWIVLGNMLEMSQAQYDKFHALMHDNNRPVQALNGRALTMKQ